MLGIKFFLFFPLSYRLVCYKISSTYGFYFHLNHCLGIHFWEWNYQVKCLRALSPLFCVLPTFFSRMVDTCPMSAAMSTALQAHDFQVCLYYCLLQKYKLVQKGKKVQNSTHLNLIVVWICLSLVTAEVEHPFIWNWENLAWRNLSKPTGYRRAPQRTFK